MASNADLSARAAPFLDLGTVAIDINKCVPGVHCRMLKVGGVGAIKDSIKEYGYKGAEKIPYSIIQLIVSHYIRLSTILFHLTSSLNTM